MGNGAAAKASAPSAAVCAVTVPAACDHLSDQCCQSACLLFAACYQCMPMLHKNPSAIGWKVQWQCHQCAHARITHTVDSARQRLACFQISQTGSCMRHLHGGQLTSLLASWLGKVAGPRAWCCSTQTPGTSHSDDARKHSVSAPGFTELRPGATLHTCGTRRPTALPRMGRHHHLKAHERVTQC